MAVLGASDCERVTSGFLAQPFNAITSLSFVAAGGWMVSRALGANTRRSRRLGLGAATVATGVGSVLYHGPQPHYAERVHDVSIVVVLSLVAAGEIDRVRRGETPERTAHLIALASSGLGAITFALGRSSSSLCDPDARMQLHGLWHAFAAASLAAYSRACLEGGRDAG